MHINNQLLQLRNILLIGLILFSINNFGQVHSIGYQGGLNLSNYTSEIDFGDKKFKAGIVSGFNYEYTFSGKYTLGADLLYSQQGFKDEVSFIDEQDNSWTSDVKFGYDYLSLPVKIGYTRGEQIKGFVKTGLCPSVLLKTQTKFLNVNALPVGFEERDAYDKVPKFDLGGLIELGAAYALKNNVELFSSITYRKSFTTISSVDHFQGVEMKHYLFSMALGLKYKLSAN